MKPERAQELYSEYREGTLSPAMKLALEQHFEADPEAKQEYDDFARVYDLLALTQVEEVEVPHGFRAGIMDRVAAESTKRPERVGFWDFLRRPRQLQAAIGVCAVVAVAVVSTVVAVDRHQGQVNTENIVPVPAPAPITIDPSQSIVQGVSTRLDQTGAINHDFLLRLPKGMLSGTVDAYEVTSTQQIRDAEIREAQAKSIATAQSITRAADLTVSVVDSRRAAPGSTLNVVFDIQGTTTDQHPVSQDVAVFTPLNPNDSVSAGSAPPMNGKYFDSLQTLASDYHVTIVADIDGAPDGGQAWSSTDGIETALARVVGAGNAVKPLGSDTYFIYRK